MRVEKLSEASRDDLEERLAELWTQNADLKDLQEYFYNAQREYLKDLDDAELLGLCDDNGVVEETK